jgi:hypothetical protein
MHADRLANNQLETFDREYVSEIRWLPIKACIDEDFRTGEFSFLDIGGGNGLFADRVLTHYPKAYGTVLDASELLIARNRSFERKTCVVGDAMNLGAAGKYDIVFCNWLLHHLVKTGDYHATRANIEYVLRAANGILKPNGRVSVYENEYNGVIDGYPSRAIFAATSSRSFKNVARRMGANTAGVGVCFLSRLEWERVFRTVGLQVRRYSPDRPWRVSLMRRVAFMLREVRCGHFWLS